MNEPTPNQPAPSSVPGSFLSRRGKILLIASLALNLLIIGAFAGAAVLHKRHRGAMEPVFGGAAIAPGEMIGFLRTLDPERRLTLKQALQSQRPKLQALRSSVQKVRDELGELAIAEPIDNAAIELVSQQLWTAEGELRRMQLSVMRTMLAIMSQPERARFIAWRKTRFEGFGRRGHGRDNAPPPI